MEDGKEQKTFLVFKELPSKRSSSLSLDQLYKNPLAKILVVEGEKTADAAQKLFADRNFICVTWQGGLSAVLKIQLDAFAWKRNHYLAR